MKSKYNLLLSLFVVVCLSSIIGCRKTELEPLSETEAILEQQRLQNKGTELKKVYISDVVELYTSINDTSNKGRTLVLAPGTYRLNANYPNAGRIELQHNMSLMGHPGKPGAVVIDVSDLPATSYVIPPTPTYPTQLRTGPIRVGNGYNVIEWITFTNNPLNIIRAMIITDIVAKQSASAAAPLAQVRIAHSVISNSGIGINILNRDAVSNGRVLEAAIEYNEIFENLQTPFGSGVQVQNSAGVSGALIKVNLRGNYIHGNRQGLNLFNSSSMGNNRVIGRSSSDRLEGNGLGLILTGGLNSTESTSKVMNNSVDFEAEATTIRNNSGFPAPISNYIPGGVFISGGNVGKLPPITGAVGTVINNRVEAELKGCIIEDNAGSSQINIFGAYSSLPSPLPAGTNNNAFVSLKGVSKKATVNVVASFPAEPAGTNIATVQRF